MKRLLYLLPLVALLIASCSKTDDRATATYDINATETGCQYYQPSTLCQAITDAPYTKEMIGDGRMVALGLNTIFNIVANRRNYMLDTIFTQRDGIEQRSYNRSWQIASYTFTYTSISSLGTPITLSGRVTLPCPIDGTNYEVQSLSLYTHYYLDKGFEPSKSLSPLDLRALYNSAVIEPDLQGYGANSDMPFCGLSYDVQGRQMLDCMTAALKIMEQHGVTLAPNGYTTCWGYSLATPALIAMARLYDEELTPSQRNAFRIKSIYAGGGPMLLDRMLELMNEDRSLNATQFQYLIPMLDALPASSLNGYTLEQFMPQWMQHYMVTVNGEQTTYLEALRHLTYGIKNLRPASYPPSLLQNNFAEDMFDNDGYLDYSNPKVTTMFSILHQLSDWGHWRPTVDIYLVYNPNDDRMPMQQALEWVDLMQPTDKLHWKESSSPIGSLATHDNAHTAATLNESINTMLYEDPLTAFTKAR